MKVLRATIRTKVRLRGRKEKICLGFRGREYKVRSLCEITLFKCGADAVESLVLAVGFKIKTFEYNFSFA